MPEKVFEVGRDQRVTLDARPDRPDLRDRIYAPPLRTLPASSPPTHWVTTHFPAYRARGLVLNQIGEGACTGFGLAAVINYILFRQSVMAAAGSGGEPAPQPGVSQRMLYHLARLYDEWPGEDYDGSSCRGAMKGWFHHGVCEQSFWPYKPKGARKPSFVPPAPGWDADAATRPVGAYYRIARDSIADMQAAIHEVGAIYASGDVHAGWRSDALRPAPNANVAIASIPVIAWTPGIKASGGHAFAIVGYDADGFIVQNSWGESWGFMGFAKLSYADWLANGTDAWVAVMGAPINARAPAVILSSSRTVSALQPELGRGLANGATAEAAEKAPSALATDAETISKHVVVLGPGGRPVQIRLDAGDASSAVRDVAYVWPKAHFDTLPAGIPKRIALYMHGGLNDLDAGLARAKIMAPAFLNNGVYPIFVVWQSGFRDALEDLLGLSFGQDLAPNRNILKDIAEGITDASDRLLELATMLGATGIWDQIKNRATGASTPEGGVRGLIDGLGRLKNDHPSLEIHAAGHSAGAIMLGASFAPMIQRGLSYKTLALFAPACTVAFANDTYLAKAGKAFRFADLHVDVLSDANERGDTVGPYRKSLLYYVSRACERHKTPLLGMEAVWNKSFDGDGLFIDTGGRRNRDVVLWRQGWAGGELRVLSDRAIVVNTVTKATMDAVHGCFDNWVEGVSRTIVRMRGGDPLAWPIKSLQGF